MLDAPGNERIALDAKHPPKHTPADVSKLGTEAAPSAEGTSEASVPQPKESPAPTSLPEDNSLMAPKPDVKAPPPVHSVPAVRPEVGRTASSGFISGRPPHDLPSKPEPSQVRPGNHRVPPRPGERIPHDPAREPRYPERSEPRDLHRDRGNERLASGSYPHGGDRIPGMDRDRIDQHWSSDRPPASGRSLLDDRQSGSHARDQKYTSRDDRINRPLGERQPSEQYQSRRDVESMGQSARDTVMPPPRSNASQHPINPDRAALIQSGQTQDRGPSNSIYPDRRSDSSRYDHQSRPERTSRGPSPVRADDRHPSRYENRHEDLPPSHGRRSFDDMTRSNPPRTEESYAPTGPRTGRLPITGASSSNQNDRFRESMKPSTIAPPLDPNHGRLNHEPSFPNRHAESQYGRLNSDNDIPSGPRMPNGNHSAAGRGARIVSAPQPQLNTQLPPQNHGPPTPVYDRQAPSGPSMRGSPRKQQQFSQYPANSSAPPTPVAQSPDTAGFHPDRLKALQESRVVTAENPPQSRGPMQGPSPVSIPPRGPNHNQLPSPAGPSPNNRGPPTGPAMTNDRNGRDKRTFAGIQNVLQQASGPGIPERSGQGASIRGRGGRANNVNAHSPNSSAPPTPGLPRQEQMPPGEDLFAGKPNVTLNSYQPEEDIPYGRGGRRGGPRDGDRQGTRQRSHSAGKDRSVGAPPRMREDEMPQGRGALRDRPRGNEGPLDRDIRGGPPEANFRGGGGPQERDLRDRGPPRDTRRSGRDDGQFANRRGEPDLRDVPDRRDDRDRRDAGGSGRKRGRGGDEGPGTERIFSDSKRPRR